jgi:hypothetical protein
MLSPAIGTTSVTGVTSNARSGGGGGNPKPYGSGKPIMWRNSSSGLSSISSGSAIAASVSCGQADPDRHRPRGAALLVGEPAPEASTSSRATVPAAEPAASTSSASPICSISRRRLAAPSTGASAEPSAGAEPITQIPSTYPAASKAYSLPSSSLRRSRCAAPWARRAAASRAPGDAVPVTPRMARRRADASVQRVAPSRSRSRLEAAAVIRGLPVPVRRAILTEVAHRGKREITRLVGFLEAAAEMVQRLTAVDSRRHR